MYFGGSLLVLDIPKKLLTIIEIYLIGYSLAVVCFDVYSALQHICCFQHNKLGTTNLDGRKQAVSIAGLVQFRFAQVFSFLLIAEIFLAHQETKRGSVTAAVDTIRSVLSSFANWSILRLLQLLPGIVHVTIYMRDANGSEQPHCSVGSRYSCVCSGGYALLFGQQPARLFCIIFRLDYGFVHHGACLPQHARLYAISGLHVLS